ncbi:GNAT family N-acetyltransferase [Nocardioides sp.]|uniref:GNAT family N-acetyltransferase n=1 Tax=Nocardioides sp. TaxID=35761 RepID=UPI002ED4663A
MTSKRRPGSTPRQRRRDRLIAQAEAALARLAVAPRDHVALGSLEEAAAGLDGLVDGGEGDTELRERLVDAPRRTHLAWPPGPALPIRTDRLVLRQREPADTADLHAIYSREDVAEYLLAPPLELDEVEEMLAERATAQADGFGLVLEREGRVVGEVALMFRGPTQSELSWVVHPDHGGRGLVTEAVRELIGLGFGHFALHRIYAELDARNTASARLCERLGMRKEAHRLADYWSKGEWTDTLQYAVLASEWS